MGASFSAAGCSYQSANATKLKVCIDTAVCNIITLFIKRVTVSLKLLNTITSVYSGKGGFFLNWKIIFRKKYICNNCTMALPAAFSFLASQSPLSIVSNYYYLFQYI